MLHTRAKGSITQPLPHSIEGALRACLTEHGQPTEHDAHITREHLERWHHRTQLLCDCARHNLPHACVHRLPTGELILRWYQGRHRPGCPFERPVSVPRQPASTHDARRKPALPRATRIDALPSLELLLRGFIRRAGMDHIHTLDLTPSGASLLREPQRFATRLFRLLNTRVGPDLTMRDTSALSLPLLEPWLSSFLPRAAPKLEPGTHGYLVCPVGAVTDHPAGTAVSDLSGQTHTLPVSVAAPLLDTGPAWLILRAGLRNGRGELIDGYAHPAYSTDLPLLVDSEDERDLIMALLDQVRFWHRWPKSRALVRLIKPAVSAETPYGPCRPSALIVRGAKSDARRTIAVDSYPTAIEGAQEEALARTDLLALMDSVDRVVIGHPGEFNTPDWRRQLTRALFSAPAEPLAKTG